MGFLALVKDPLRSSSLLTAINSALTTASLPTFNTAAGILPSAVLLPDAPSWPAIAVDWVGDRLIEVYSNGEERRLVTLDMTILLESTSQAAARNLVEDFCDTVRAAVETALKTTYTRITCVGMDAEGGPATNLPEEPARLVVLSWDIEAIRQKGTA